MQTRYQRAIVPQPTGTVRPPRSERISIQLRAVVVIDHYDRRTDATKDVNTRSPQGGSSTVCGGIRRQARTYELPDLLSTRALR